MTFTLKKKKELREKRRDRKYNLNCAAAKDVSESGETKQRNTNAKSISGDFVRDSTEKTKNQPKNKGKTTQDASVGMRWLNIFRKYRA